MKHLRPIRTEQDYAAAMAALEQLWGAKAGTVEVEQQGLTRKDLERILGTRTRVSEILNRKRGLSIAMIRRLHAELGIPADVLIRPTRIESAA